MYTRMDARDERGVEYWNEYASESAANTGQAPLRSWRIGAKLTRLAFRERFTFAELVAIKGAEDAAPDPQMRYALRVLADSLATASDVDPANPATISGVQMLAKFKLIAPERVAVILAPVG